MNKKILSYIVCAKLIKNFDIHFFVVMFFLRNNGKTVNFNVNIMINSFLFVPLQNKVYKINISYGNIPN